MSPDDDLTHSYLIMDMHKLTKKFFAFSLVCTFIGLYFAAHPHYLDESYFSNHTNYVKSHYKTFENGSLYYDYIDNNGDHRYGPLGKWFVRFLNGEWRYSYGNSWHNYCDNRIIPRDEWMTSIIRSMNHLVTAQIFFRFTIVITIPYSLFQYLILSLIPRHSITGQNINFLYQYPLITIEIINKISLFLICCIQSDQDERILFLSKISIILLSLTIIAKMFLILLEEANPRKQVFFTLIIIGIIISHGAIYSELKDYLIQKYCDSLTTSFRAVCQLFYVMVILIFPYYKIEKLKGVSVVMFCTQPEIDDLINVQNGIEKS